MKNKDLIMFGMIIGIMFFFIGAMISSAFPSDVENLASYKAAAFMKLFGIGILTACMVVGGIIIESIEKNFRMLLFLLGLILLIIYIIGSPVLNWDVSGESESTDDDYSDKIYEDRPTSLGTPGFEVIYVLISIGIFLLIRKRKLKG